MKILFGCVSAVVLGMAIGADARSAAPDPSPAWASQAQGQIEAAEYEASWHAGQRAYQAPNRAQGFRTYFTDRGIRAVPRIESESAWEWGLEWVGYGGEVPPAEIVASKNRIEYRRGALTEWYENRPDGLEQGFLLTGPPAHGPVQLELALTGSLRPVFAEDGQAVDFVAADGKRLLRYAQLHVTDARGDVVPARMEGITGGIRLVLDAGHAVYPLTVDPLTFSPVWTNESNQATAEFGRSVGTAGDVNGDGYSDVIIGAPFYDNGQTDEGRAFVFLGSASGLAAAPAWSAESDQASAQFGASVATAGDVNGDDYSDVIIGAPLYDNGQTNEGRAYVYLGSAAGLAANPVWTKEIDQASADYGASVASAGDVNGDGYADVIVGAYLYDNGQTNEGAAFAYLGSASGPAATASWVKEGEQSLARFGYSVATAGDVNGDGYADVIVGAPLYANGQSNEGRAFIYPGSPSGLSTTQLWFQEANQTEAQFGFSVATAGDTNGDGYADVLVGAWQYTNGQSFEGRAFLYLGGPTGPPNFAIWTAESDTADAYMGWSVGTAGDINGDGYADIVVTAPFWFISATVGGGEAFVYLGGPSGPTQLWNQNRQLANAAYGWSAATAGDVNGDGYADVLVGAPWDDNGQTNEGIAYLYSGSPDGGWDNTFAWSESNQASAQEGVAVASAGDVNGDGYGDVIVGAPFYDNGEADEGRAYLFLGSASGLSSTLWNFETNQADAHFGKSVGTAGDVNGDGYSDVIVGAPDFDNPSMDVGGAYLFLGSASGLSTSPAWALHGAPGSLYGSCVGTAGDVNGDGFADFLVGAPLDTSGQTHEGRAYFYLGSSGPLSTSAAWVGESNQAESQYGTQVKTAGDVNRDGYSDVVVGAPYWTNGEAQEGRVSLYLGSAAGLSASDVWNLEGGVPSANYGYALASAGDVNGDGYSDVVIGVHTLTGHFDVYHGSSTGLPLTPSFTLTSSCQLGSEFGISASGAGDVNGDGFADIVIGAPSCINSGQMGQVFGYAFVYLGSPSGITAFGGASFNSTQNGDRPGDAVASAGDLNGDGYADVVIGAPLYDSGQTNEGRAQFFFGSRKGIALNARQRTSDDARSIAPLGLSESGTAFRIAALARTPFGRGRAKLEWEVKPLGTPFDGSGTGIGSFTDTGLSGGALAAPVTGLTGNTPYHWRVRLLYDQASVPFAKRSRWLTTAWNGAAEAKLRTAPAAAVGAGRSSAFAIAKAGLGVTMSWIGAASCDAADNDHAIYEGTLGSFTSHVPITCSTAPGHSWNFTPAAGNRYFLLVPINATREGSHGLWGAGLERPRGAPVCQPQLVSCP